MKVKMLRNIGTQLVKELALPDGEYVEGETYDVPEAAFEELTKRSLIEAAKPAAHAKSTVLPAEKK